MCQGTYHEQVAISKPLSLAGQQATIDESGVTPALNVSIPGLGTQTIFAAVVILSSQVQFSGFTVTNALGEGVVAAGLTSPISDISISHNTVVHNDLGGGGVPPASTYFECAAQGPEPRLRDHRSRAQSRGPERRRGSAALGRGRVRQRHPGQHGDRQRDSGRGRRVLFANAAAGTASYNNLVEGNYIAGNGLSGVTMHAHTIGPGQFEDLSGNTIIGNKIGKNNIDGDTLDSPASPEDLQTTGVLVFSGGAPVSVTIARNLIFNNHFGIWLSKPVTAQGLRTNVFVNVSTPISARN